ncbi:porin [Burkholderia sp. 22PA0099]|uniref:porin n=1 Tax=Burkholderia sp. 22PA0099 TaxID=3237372 RepID=UPI0039C0B607
MKKLLLAGATFGACSSVAYAQSSVVLYGVADVGINIQSNVQGHAAYAQNSGMMQGSRLGFLGSEDLGGGMKAIFQLENGFDITSGRAGQGGLLFGRQAFVGLSNRFGVLTFGRQYDSHLDAVLKFAAANQGASIAAAHPADLDNTNYTYRSNNSIKFTSNPLQDITASAQYSVGGQPGNFTGAQIWSLALSYSNGATSAGVGYLDAKNPNIGLLGSASATPQASSSANVTSPVISGLMSASAYKGLAAGAAYALGDVTLSALYSHTRFLGLGDLTSGPNPAHLTGSATFDTYEVNLQYRPSPSWLLGAAYLFTDGGSSSGAVGARYRQVAADIHFLFSKRTDVYIACVYQHAAGRDSTGRSAVAAINGLSPSSSADAALVRIGLRQRF